ncbi:MAG: hypothetical protein ABIP19_13650, partial [Dermatophilaceae bacterium]
MNTVNAMTSTAVTPTTAPASSGSRSTESAGRIGDSPLRPDGPLKVAGTFAFASDLWVDEMIWGVTLRSPHASARIASIDIGPALATPGVYAVLTADDIPGENAMGLEHQDQPVLAAGVVRYQGEPVALVAADHPEIARQAAKKIVVEYQLLQPLTDPRASLDPTSRKIHEGGNVVRHVKVRKGVANPTAPVVV